VWRRKTTGVIAVVAGVVLFVAGLVDHAFAAPKAALLVFGVLIAVFGAAVVYQGRTTVPVRSRMRRLPERGSGSGRPPLG
jgi:hypothetical protein